MKSVILAEKPSQAKAYTSAFKTVENKEGYFGVSGGGYNSAIITYGFGHLVSLCAPDEYNAHLTKWSLETLPIVPQPFKMKVAPEKKKQFNIVKKHLDSADEIIIATDPDREGEAIARYIINLSGNNQKPIKRLWINSLETPEIKKGFQSLKDGQETYGLYKEAETRSFSDWLVGMNLSRLYSLHMQHNGMKGAFSIGRVQTPTLQLVYERNKAIENFKSQAFYELYAHFESEAGDYTGKYAERFDSKNELEEFIESNQLNQKGTVKEVHVEEKRTYAPRLYSLSDLQADMNKRFGYGASETLDLAQSLYEKKVISYPRTDTNYIGTPEFNYLKDKLPDYLKLVNVTLSAPQLEQNKRYVNSQKVEEHYAIIPTRTLPNFHHLSDKEVNVYRAILYRVLAIFEKPYIYDETTILTEVNSIKFKTTGKIEKEQGYQRLLKESKDNKDKALPHMKSGDKVSSTPEIKEGKTTPPKHYTEGSLITAMKHAGRDLDNEEDQAILKEVEGIGTEATRANVIDTLKKQDYIRLKGKNIFVTLKGETLCETLNGNEITQAELTAEWERHLKSIRAGELSQDVFLGSIVRFIEHMIEEAPKLFEQTNVKEKAQQIVDEKVVAPCPQCDGKLVDKGKLYGCTNYPDCQYALSKTFRKRKLTKKNMKELVKTGETTVTNIKSKSGSKYNAKVRLNDKNYIDFVYFVN